MALLLCTVFYIHCYWAFLKKTLQGTLVSSRLDDGRRNRATWKAWVTPQRRD